MGFVIFYIDIINTKTKRDNEINENITRATQTTEF